tara:strand:- start:86 stop:844 length:759 start_codon:yes stop_codon:yes gene_type:complete
MKVLIVGGNGYIGRGLTKLFLEKGHNVTILDQNIIKNKNNKCKQIKVDLRKSISLQKKVKELFKNNNFDTLYCLNATKTDNLKKFFEKESNYSLKTWNEVLNVNLTSTYIINKHYAEGKINSKKIGNVINFSSIYGLLAPDFKIYTGAKFKNIEIHSPAIYSSSKAALIGLTKYFANYYGRKNVRFNCLIPGGIKSDNDHNNVFVRKYSEKVPLNRMASLKDIVGISYMMSLEEFSYVNGQEIIVDGGFSTL